MSHQKLFDQGRISRREYENAEYLKDSGQHGLYRMYEKALDRQVRERDRNARRVEKGLAVHVRKAEVNE